MIERQNVSFSYPGDACGGLKNISLTIPDGQFVLLCGRSGCGKTTLTRLVNGLIPQFFAGELTGRVLLDGENISALPMYRIAEKAGSVFRNPRAQFFNVDTDSEIAFGMENEAVAQEKLRPRVDETARALHIEPLLGRSIFALSGGEKQKIAFASVYAMEPEMYLLDEPSSNLDMTAIAELTEHLRLIKSQGKTVIAAEHRLYYLLDVADRVIYLENGAVAGDWTAEEFRRIPAGERRRMGLRAIDLSEERPAGPAAPNAAPVLELQNVTLDYQKQPVLKNISLKAAPGEVIAVAGHNGAGKTTFSRALCALHKEVAGSYLWNVKPLTAKARMKRAYMVMQDVNYDMLLGAFVGAFGGAGNLARGNANATAEAAPTQQTASAETQAATPIKETAEATQSAQETEQHPQNPQGTDTQEARPGMLERVRAAREQKKAAEEQATAEFFEAQAQCYEEHGWEAALPKELETKNVSKWVKARTAAILEENAARSSREAKATPEVEEQAAKGKTGADYLAEAAGLSKGAEAPQTRTEAQGDNPAPTRAQDAKQAGSGVLNSALNLNSVEMRAEAPAQAQKNAASMQQKVNIDNTASPVYNDTSKIMGGVSGVAGTGIAADSNGVPGIYQDSNAVHQGRGGLDGVSVGSGLVLLNDKSQATLRERGVAVEAKDASADKAAFSAALASARESDTEHGWAVTPKSAQELAESGAKLITTQNGAAGLAVAKQV